MTMNMEFNIGIVIIIKGMKTQQNENKIHGNRTNDKNEIKYNSINKMKIKVK